MQQNNSGMEQIILGVDPGTLILGYSILRVTDNKPSVEAMDVLYLKNIDDYNLRIRKIFDSMIQVIDRYHPDHLAIEAPFFGKNVQSMLKLGRAQGVTIAAAMSRDISFTEYEPKVIKQYITGNGNASKEQVHRMLEMHLKTDLHTKYLDASDALAAAFTCFLAQTSPLSQVCSVAKTKTSRPKGRKQQWSDFIDNNPDRVL